MATTTIPWDDGSSDNIYLTYSSASGDQTVQVSSDANTGSARTRVITFTATGTTPKSLTISQDGAPVPTTVKLIPSRYWRSSTTYVTVANPDNMYADISSSNYATLSSTRRSTEAYYTFINGFNIEDIPTGAHVTSFIVRIRGYRNSRINTAATYNPCLTNTTNGTVFDGTSASSTFGTSATTVVIPTGDLTWEDIVADGANFSIRISVTRSSSGNQGYVYIYGAEIEVTYTI